MSAVVNETVPADSAAPASPAPAETKPTADVPNTGAAAGAAGAANAETPSAETANARIARVEGANAEIPNATFDDMALRVGDRIQLAPLRGVRGQPCMVRLIGYVRDVSLLVTTPAASCWLAPLMEGDTVVTRVFSGRSAFGFLSRIDKIIKLPFDYLHLSFPQMIAGRVIRKSRRVKSQIPVVVDGGAESTTISNLSSSGAEICSLEPLGEPGKTLHLSFTIEVHGAQTQVAVDALIRSSHAVGSEGKAAWRSGVEFTALTAETAAVLKNLIYQELIERPQSVL